MSQVGQIWPGAPKREAVRTFCRKLLDSMADLDTSKSDDKILDFLNSKQEEKVGNNSLGRHYSFGVEKHSE